MIESPGSPSPAGAVGAADAPTSRLMVLLFSDIVGSTDLKNRLGTVEYAALLSRHDEIFRRIIAGTSRASILKDTGDGFFASFATASDAVRAALRFQHELVQHAPPLKVRVGLHLGEVAEIDPEASGMPKVVGLAADLTARLMGLAAGGQILMTRVTFDDARQFVREHPSVEDAAAPELRWVAHGQYLFKGSEEPIEVFEVGAIAVAPLAPPPDSDKARRNVRPGDEVTLGWRPAGGLELRGRANWILRQKLGEGGFGEVWLAEHAKTGSRRVFKFCFEPERLRGLKREVVLFRLLKEALGDRRDIARIIDFQFEENPYFIETEYFPAGTLHDYAESRGGIGALPLGERVAIVAKVAEALSAAHGVGVLHKDLKPSNILMRDDGQGAYPVLTDFGIGILTDRSLLDRHDITVVGFTQSAATENESSRTGTRMYAPPESLLNRPFTVQGDVYALGVLLYQMVVGELNRPLAEGWERDVGDDLLREDIAACVEGEPSRRLASAAELANRLNTLEVRRARRLEAINAQLAAARRARTIKAMAASLVVALVLAVGLGVAWFERHRRVRIEATHRADAESARDRIALEAAKASQVTDFLVDMLTSADPARTTNPDLRVRDALDRAAAGIDGKQLQPEVEAAIRAAVGRTYLTLGLYPPAGENLARAVELARRSPDMDADAVKALSDLGAYFLYTAQYDQAQRAFDETLRLRERTLGPDHPDTADSLYNLSLLYGLQRQFDKSLEVGRKALAIREKAFGGESAPVAASLQYLAQYTLDAGRFAEAEPLFLRSLELREKLLGPDHFEVGNSHNNLALVYLNTNRLDDAERHFRAAIANYEKSLSPTHPNLGMALANLGGVHLRRQEFAEALEPMQRSLQIVEQTKGPDHPDMVHPLYGLATIHYSLEQYTVAADLYERALEIARRAPGPDAPITLATTASLGFVLRDDGQLDRAEPHLRTAVEGMRRIGMEPQATQTEVGLVECVIWAGKFEQAEPMAKQLLERAGQYPDDALRGQFTSGALQLLVRLYDDWQKPDVAAEYRSRLDATSQPAGLPSTGD